MNLNDKRLLTDGKRDEIKIYFARKFDYGFLELPTAEKIRIIDEAIERCLHTIRVSRENTFGYYFTGTRDAVKREVLEIRTMRGMKSFLRSEEQLTEMLRDHGYGA